MPHSYRAKPIEITAVRVTADNVERLLDEAIGVKHYEGPVVDSGGSATAIRSISLVGRRTTPGRRSYALLGDYIIIHPGDTFEVVPGPEFESKYERID